MYQVTHLENGLAVATAEMPHMSSVSLGVWVGTGGRYEPAEINGVSHFIEHLLFKGTRKRSALDISQQVEGIGGYINAFTCEETTCFYSKARHDALDELMDVLMDMFLHSTFDPVEIEKERNVIKEELAMYKDQPPQYVHEILNETLWPNQPLGRSLTGTEESLDRITRKHLLGYRKENYVPPCTLIAAAGNITHKEILRSVQRYSKNLWGGERPRFTPAVVSQNAPRVKLETRKTEQTQLALGIRACSRHDERRYALRLLNTMLGENMSSRLFQKVREDHGLAYSICSSLSFYEDVGSLVISAGVDTSKLKECMRLVMGELKSFTEKAPSSAELQRARDYVLGQLDLSLEGTENQMMWLGEQILGYGKIIPVKSIKRNLEKVRPADIRAVAKAFIKPENFNLALVSPLKNDRELRPLLAA